MNSAQVVVVWKGETMLFVKNEYGSLTELGSELGSMIRVHKKDPFVFAARIMSVSGCEPCTGVLDEVKFWYHINFDTNEYYGWKCKDHPWGRGSQPLMNSLMMPLVEESTLTPLIDEKEMEACRVLKQYNTRMFLQEDFIKNGRGSLRPVRAIDIRCKANDFGRIKETMDKYANIVRRLAIDKTLTGNERLPKGMTHIVGYFAASAEGLPVKPGLFRFGYSLCSPKDEFDKNMALIKAMKTQWVCDCKSKVSDILEKMGPPWHTTKFKPNGALTLQQIDENTLNFRIWPVPLREQAENFIRFAMNRFAHLPK